MTKPIRLLLVEDNPGDAELTREALASSKLVLDIHVVVDGQDALDYLLGVGRHAGAQLPDLILLDLNLPKMDGREFLHEVKLHRQLRPIPIVVLTSSDAEKDIVESYSLGASCFITKPVGLTEFQTIVQSIQHFWFTVVRLP
jgi:chemotaxis family two-component system response regulator Rcp1